MNLNFFFNEFYDEKLFNKINTDDKNFVINGIFLTKINNFNYEYSSIFSEQNEKVLSKYIDFKKRWQKKSLKRIKNKIKKKYGKTQYSNFIKIFEHPLLQLFWHHNHSSIDCLFFISHLNTSKFKEINIFLGENYRYTEIFTIYFWLESIIEIIQNKNINFYIVGRKLNLKKIKKNFYKKFLNTNSRNKFNLKPNQNKNIKSIIWDEAIINKSYWINKIINFEDHNLFKFNNHSKKNVNFINLNYPFNNEENETILNFLKKKRKIEKDLNFFSQYVEDFFVNCVLKISLNRIKKINLNLKRIFSKSKINKVLLPSVPLIETIALNVYANKINSKIYLLPHSTTPTHEYEPKYFYKMFGYTNSKYIMPSYNIKKFENKIILDSDKKLTNFKKEKKIYDILNLYYNKVTQLNLSHSIDYSKKILDQSYKQLLMKYKNSLIVKKKNFKIGFILNIEQYEFLTEYDFLECYKLIGKILTKFLNNNNIKFYIRRKPGWTNYNLFLKVLQENFEKGILKNLIITYENISLRNFLSKIDLAIFFNGSGAMLECMFSQTPVILVQDKKFKLINDDYIKFPEKIVPKINYSKLNKLTSKNYTRKLNVVQKKFMIEKLLN